MNPLLPGGLFIVLDGIDGAGKTTQCSLLAQYFGEKGLLCTISKEPTSCKWGAQLRASARAGRLTLEEELELFILDRKDHIKRSIGPTLAAGGVVILDRYYYSTMAYQGSRGFDPEEIRRRHAEFAPEPDLAIFLDLSPSDGLERILSRGDTPNAFENVQALEEARRIFNEIEGENIITLDAARSIQEVKRDVFLEVLTVATNKIARAGLERDALGRTLALIGGDPLDTAATGEPSGVRVSG